MPSVLGSFLAQGMARGVTLLRTPYSAFCILTKGEQPMTPSYRDTLEHIRRAFPQPVSDPIHDSYFVHSIMRALDQVDALKTQLPTLGPVIPGDFAEAQNAELPAEMSSVEAVTAELVGYLRGMTISSHPQTQQNVIKPRRVIMPASEEIQLGRDGLCQS